MVERDVVRRSYDALAETYAAERSETGHDVTILEEFLEELDDPDRVLDAGCGSGSPVLTRLAETVTAVGLDFSREQLRLAADNAPGAALLQGDMTGLPFEDGVFDAVVAYWSLIHVPLADHRRVLGEFARVLAPGGWLLVCEGTDEWVGRNPDWLDTGVEMQWEIGGAETTRAQLEAAGFEVVDTWGVAEDIEDDEADGEDEPEDDADDEPWTFFAARLEE